VENSRLADQAGVSGKKSSAKESAKNLGSKAHQAAREKFAAIFA
jgi:hypothetical protein